MTDQCIFCKIIAGDIPCYKVYENDLVLAFLDIGPLSDGHTLVIPKQHIDRFEKCPPQLAAELAACMTKIAPAVTQVTNAPGYNILNNNGRCAGQLVDHIHFHIIPRKPDDSLLPKWPAGQYPPGRAEQIAEKIIQSL